ncbi:MAG: hypothetical protein ACI8WM_001459 [Burkholderiaceae bacterium]|jgi:hypothetical protein
MTGLEGSAVVGQRMRFTLDLQSELDADGSPSALPVRLGVWSSARHPVRRSQIRRQPNQLRPQLPSPIIIDVNNSEKLTLLESVYNVFYWYCITVLRRCG